MEETAVEQVVEGIEILLGVPSVCARLFVSALLLWL